MVAMSICITAMSHLSEFSLSWHPALSFGSYTLSTFSAVMSPDTDVHVTLTVTYFHHYEGL